MNNSERNNNFISNLLKPDLIQFLIKKLKIGNLRGSHLNCLPGNSRNRFSLFELDKVLSTENLDFYKLLISKASFSLNISIPEISEDKYEKLSDTLFDKATNYKEFMKFRAILSRRLNNISYDLKNEFQEYGTKSFGFGFPTLVIKNPKQRGKVLVAPLLIWYLDLKQDLNRSHSWTISKNEDSPIVFNEVLFNYLKESYSVSFDELKDIQEKILEDDIVDSNELGMLITLFEKKINQEATNLSNNDYEHLILEDYPSKDSLPETLGKENFMIINNGAFAFYRTYKESIIQDMENILKNLDTLQIEQTTSYQSDFFSAISTDPSQSKLLETLGSEHNILVQGPPGTGKSQSLTAILTNALRNRVKCLVVCEKKTAMEILYSNLKKMGLSHLAIMIDDPIKDRNALVQAVRDKIEKPKPVYPSSNLERNLSEERDKYKTIRSSLEQFHIAKDAKQLEGQTREDLIAKFLKLHNDQKSLKGLNPKNFSFDEKEYRESLNVLEHFKILSEFLIDEDPLLFINSQFIKEDYNNSRNKLINIIESMTSCLSTMSECADKTLKEYSVKLETDFIKSASTLKTLCENIITHYDSVSSRGKKRLEYDNLDINLTTKLFANISFINREVLLFKQNTSSGLIKLEEELNSNLIFNKYIGQVNLDKSNVSLLLNEIKRINECCSKNNIRDLIDKHLKHLTLESNLFIESDNMSNIKKQFEKYISLLKEDFLDKEIFAINKNCKYNDLSLLCKRKLSSFKEITKRFDYLHEYYLMLEYLSDQDEKIKSLLNEVITIPRSDWNSEFELWFIQNLLIKNSNNVIFRNDHDIRSLSKILATIRKIYPELIINYWDSMAAQSIQKYSGNTLSLKSIYNMRGANGKRRNSLRTILNYDFDSFTNFFPIVLTNPSTASSIFPLKLGLFEVVIFDEASQLRIEDTFASFLRGKTHIVSGDKHQMPPSSFFISDIDVVEDNEDLSSQDDIEKLQNTLERNHMYNLVSSESLLDFATQQEFKEVYLDIHYRSLHPDLIEFSNKAFYGSRLVPTPPLQSIKPAINFYQVDGTYQSEDNVNVTECEKVIEIIGNEYKTNRNAQIGVATLNINQRNLILDKLSELSATNEQFALMMSQLEQNGFFVKNLENIQGDERDIIIISTTFGRREDKSFTQNYGPLSRKVGYRLLNVIITRAKERLHLVTSIPYEYYSQYNKSLEKEGNNGNGIFYAYLNYAEAVSEKNNLLKDKILKDISTNVDLENINNEDLELTESPFEEEVFQRINKFIQKGKLHLQQKVGGFRLDMVVDTTDAKKKIVIECDGATYHSTIEAHYWDIFRQEYLEEKGYVFHRIWSENWFEDANSETRKLLAFIKNNNGLALNE
jgi:superfamily I DNA and/or RNA helicase/very-short-patch-repair endonuclease